MGAARRFSSNERSVLFIAADGKCSHCRQPLHPGWHADHVIPWSLGGKTDVLNGQALCSICNLKKGVRMLQDWPSNRKLRRWQQSAFNKFMAHATADFLAVATPGAGKTTFALRVAFEVLCRRIADRLVVVVPSEHLKIQWAEAAAQVGIHLDPKWSNSSGAVASDYHGIVVTYAQVAANPDLHRYLCRTSTFCVFDEIHHAGDENPWGDSLRNAYDAATKRLLLSGTPFRSDGNPIPFVTYIDGKSRADFVYSYADALGDDVCRPVLFPSYEGQMKWYSRGKEYNHSFRDPVSDERAAQRLRTALDAVNGDWIKKVIRDADAQLTRIRETHPDAGGLIVAIKREHAGEIASILRANTGEEPTVVTIDDPDASTTIAEYAASSKRWIVAIKMVSEGVDIPRLRVGVYATNVLTEMFFRQVVGRFVRMLDGIEDQNAYLYIPRDETLIGYAQQIKEERDHQLEEETEAARKEANAGVDGPPQDDKTLSLFLAISAHGQADDVFVDQDRITQGEISEAVELGKKYGSREDPAILARILREARLGGFSVRAEAKTSQAPPEEPLHVKKKRLRKVCSRLVAQLREATDRQFEHQDIWTALMKRDGVSQTQATIDQLNGRIEHLQAWIKGLPDVR